MKEYVNIARRLLGLREALDFSIEDMAKAVGVELKTVELYESGTHEIPVGYLLKVAQACGVDTTALISGTDSHLVLHSLVRAGKGLSVDRRKDYDYRSLAYRFKDRKMEPFEITVNPKTEDELNFAEHTGQEFIYCIEGVLEVRLGSAIHELSVGDSLYFDSRTPHAMRALGSGVARFIDVIL